ARHCKRSFLPACVIETLHRCTQKVLRNHRPDLAGSGLLNRMRLVQNQEIVGEEKSALPFDLLLHPAQEHEKQRVINNYDRRALEFSTRELIEGAVEFQPNYHG